MVGKRYDPKVLLVAPMPIRAAPATEPTAGCDGVVQIPLSECLALESLYNSTAGPQWFERAGWLVTTTPCSWYGVTCQGGHVTTLDLQDNNLTGNLPSQCGSGAVTWRTSHASLSVKPAQRRTPKRLTARWASAARSAPSPMP